MLSILLTEIFNIGGEFSFIGVDLWGFRNLNAIWTMLPRTLRKDQITRAPSCWAKDQQCIDYYATSWCKNLCRWKSTMMTLSVISTARIKISINKSNLSTNIEDLCHENRELRQENRDLRQYIEGLRKIRSCQNTRSQRKSIWKCTPNEKGNDCLI